MNRHVIPEGASLAFADYFYLNSYVDRVLEELGYSFQAQACQLPKGRIDADRIAAEQRGVRSLHK